MLLNRARELGTEVIRGRASEPIVRDGAVCGVRVVHEDGGAPGELASDVLVDATGQAALLSSTGVAAPKTRGVYDRRVAVYGHFKNVLRDAGDGAGNTLLFFREAGLWSWFIPIDDEVTSIGLVVSAEYLRRHGESRADFLLRELREFNAELARRSAAAELDGEVRASANYSYRIEQFSGRGWLCVGDAHRFIDPLFSFGVNIALQEGRQAAFAIRDFFDGKASDELRPFHDFERWAESGLEVCQTVLDGFTFHTFAFGLIQYEHGDDFIDLLAGRVWDDPGYTGLTRLRSVVADARAGAGR